MIRRSMPRLRRSSPKMIRRAVELRHEPTPAESRLWTVLRGDRFFGVKFRRQHAIGPYIVDFCCVQQKLIIELDGSQHVDQASYDRERTIYLESQGCRVIRFWNSEVLKDMDSVLRAIQESLLA